MERDRLPLESLHDIDHAAAVEELRRARRAVRTAMARLYAAEEKLRLIRERRQ